MEPRPKWNKIILAANIILFQKWFRATLKYFKTIVFWHGTTALAAAYASCPL